ncbi:metallo-beta-lactamase class B [Clostridium saccharoperbutylacetonicum]|uniref:beta-lactamase n=1 Tax=Clostridium saccharoperbutylacetonicum N1-4(HMT) TaxID=931276 RepID=M1MD99_9CLOT|nr:MULTISPECIES: subclass B1 metallo-beta-lactamase [Clostridium]AGF55899.1 Zn-dependent hydrolase, glyoxylase [Clostridium saccharoperbutylacetonicum N1-4(HMT)]NRT63362.1 metallo-beta-lactamase class B [Clostridium saccharoperbutylacetonicum]NSB26724.1 metallo-beta-lactamase class B [Clostridium saccharoperbutylacetonicum]NSB46075.1 metallo-beta-lactamase class B [Clostridium saccharoperbutylacetonicum]
MKKYKHVFTKFLSVLLSIFILSLIACSNNVKENSKAKESVLEIGSDDSNFVQLTKINDNVWVHTTYYSYNGSRTLSNGLLILTSKGLVLIDTPWTDEQTKELIKLTKEKFKQDIIAAVITHAHIDRIGGIKTLLDKKIDVKSTTLTAQLAEKYGFDKPNSLINNDDEVLEFGKTKLEVYFPGKGHTIDNIVVWLPEDKILFGGCIVKPVESNSIGNTADADIKEWPNSIKNLMNKFSDSEIVITSHGSWGNKQILTHTLDLLKKA